MIVEYSVWSHVDEILRSYTSEHDQLYEMSREKRRDYLRKIQELVNNRDKLREVVREEALKSTKSTWRKVERTLVEYTRHLEKTIETLEKPPQWFVNASIITLLNEVNGIPSDIYKYAERYIRDIMKNIPGRVNYQYEASLYINKKRVGLIVNPTDEEIDTILSSNEYPISTLLENYLKLRRYIHLLIRENVSVDKETYTSDLFGVRITNTMDEYIKLLDYLGKYDEMEEIIRSQVETLRNTLESNGIKVVDESVSLYSVVLSLDPNTVFTSNSGVDPVLRNGEIEIVIETEKSTLKTRNLKVIIKWRSGKLEEKRNLNNRVISTITKEVMETLETAMEKALRLAEISELVRTTFEKHGFDYVFDTTYDGKYKIKGKQKVKDATVYVTYSFSEDSSLVNMEGDIVLHRTGYKISPEEIVFKIYDMSNIHEDIPSKISVKGTRITGYIELDPEDIDNSLVKAVKSARTLVEAVDAVIRERKAKQQKRKISQEVAVGFFALEYFSHEEGLFEKKTGRPARTMYSIVSRVLSKVSPPLYNQIRDDKYRSVKSSASSVIRELIKHNYITIEPDGNVYINGKPVKTLLKHFISEDYLDHLNRKLAKEVIMWTGTRKFIKELIDYSSSSRPVSTELVNILIEENWINTNTIRIRGVNGKTIWDILSEDDKKRIISDMPTSSIVEVLSDTELGEIVRDDLDKFIEEGLKRRDPNLSSLIVYKFYPKAIGLTGKERLEKTKDFIGIRLGLYTLQVVVTPETLDRNKWKSFILYRNDKKLGMPVKAKTMIEALSKGMKQYDDYLREVELVKSISYMISKRDIYYREIEVGYKSGYKIPLLIYKSWSNKRWITKGTYDKLTSKQEEADLEVVDIVV